MVSSRSDNIFFVFTGHSLFVPKYLFVPQLHHCGMEKKKQLPSYHTTMISANTD